jgi:hypothetical protein
MERSRIEVRKQQLLHMRGVKAFHNTNQESFVSCQACESKPMTIENTPDAGTADRNHSEIGRSHNTVTVS